MWQRYPLTLLVFQNFTSFLIICSESIVPLLKTLVKELKEGRGSWVHYSMAVANRGAFISVEGSILVSHEVAYRKQIVEKSTKRFSEEWFWVRPAQSDFIES